MVDTPDDTPRIEASHQGDDALPARLRALRLAHQLTQRALAHRAGLPLRVIGRLERGQRRRITLTLVQALARGLETARISAASRSVMARERERCCGQVVRMVSARL